MALRRSRRTRPSDREASLKLDSFRVTPAASSFCTDHCRISLSVQKKRQVKTNRVDRGFGLRSLSTNLRGQKRWTDNRTTVVHLSEKVLAMDGESLEKCLCSLDTKLFIDHSNTNGGFDRLSDNYLASAIALVEYAEYHFLDSSVFIFRYATDFIAVCSLSALIAKQCKVH